MDTLKPCSLLDRLRKPKIANMSIFDWGTSLLAAALIGRLLKLKTVMAWILYLVAWVAFGVGVHYAVGVPTMLGYYLGLNAAPERKDCI